MSEHGGAMSPERKRGTGHAVDLTDEIEKGSQIDCLPTPTALQGSGAPHPGHTPGLKDVAEAGRAIVYMPTPTSFDESAERRISRQHVPHSAHSTNLAWTVAEDCLPSPRAADWMAHTDMPGSWRHARQGNGSLAEVLGLEQHKQDERRSMEESVFMPTPTSRDGKGMNQRGGQDCLPGAVELGTALCPTPNAMDAMDDGVGVRFGRFEPAIRRWERVLGRPAPCPTQATDGLRRWVMKANPEYLDARWLARHAPLDDGKARLDGPERSRVLRRWQSAPGPLVDPLWLRVDGIDPDVPIPATRLPGRAVLAYWKAVSASRFPSPAHLSPRFVEWMMGLPDGWVTDPAIWKNVKGNHRNMQLRALGNGVVPSQAGAAIGWALGVRERLAAEA
jgi:hypothetical protein